MTKKTTQKETVTVAELAALIRVNPITLRRWIAKKLLPPPTAHTDNKGRHLASTWSLSTRTMTLIRRRALDLTGRTDWDIWKSQQKF